MDPYITNFSNFLVFIVANEAIIWSWFLARHSFWMRKNHPYTRKERRCFAISYRTVGLSSAFAGFWLFIIDGLWVYLNACVSLPLHFYILVTVVMLGVQSTLVVLYSVLAKCAELSPLYWPLLSRYIFASNEDLKRKRCFKDRRKLKEEAQNEKVDENKCV